MQSVDFNLSLAEAMLEDLEAYLLAQELFWPMSTQTKRGWPPFPRLTVGGLLLTLDELQVQGPEMPPAQAAAHSRLRSAHDRARSKWPVLIERKCAKEARSRLNLWRAYISDLEENPNAAEHYPHDVRQRVMLGRIAALAESQPDFEDVARGTSAVDARLRGMFVGGEFIWDPRLAAIYAREQFWYLYGHPQTG